MSQFLIINSADRADGDTSFANYSLLRGMPKYSRAKIESCLVASTNNVGPANNKIYFTSSIDGPLVGTITPGIYTSTTISAAIAVAMNISSVVYTVSVVSGIITITPSAGTVQMTFGSNHLSPAAVQSAITLGFSPVIDKATANPLVGGYINLGWPQYLIFDVSLLSNCVQSINYKETGTFTMILDNNSGTYTLFTPNNDYEVCSDYSSNNTFNITCRGPGGELYTPSDYIMILRLS